MRDQQCPWRCLGVAPDASPVLVRKRYLQLALLLHPDKQPHTGAREAFEAVESAYSRVRE